MLIKGKIIWEKMRTLYIIIITNLNLIFYFFGFDIGVFSCVSAFMCVWWGRPRLCIWRLGVDIRWDRASQQTWSSLTPLNCLDGQLQGSSLWSLHRNKAIHECHHVRLLHRCWKSKPRSSCMASTEHLTETSPQMP